MGFFISPYIYLYMKIIITKEQYKLLVFSLLETLVGKLSIKTTKDKWKEDNADFDYHDLYDESGEEIANIWVKGNLRNKGCKKDLTLNESFSQALENYIPYFKHKIFSDVLIEYVYKHTKIKCDCIQYDYDFKPRVEKNYDGEEVEYIGSKTRKYNVKKKKKIKESVDGKSSLENLIYEFLNDDFDPDYNWGPELFDFYREDVKEHGVIPFYIKGSEAYVYYEDGTLEIMPWVCEKLNEYFNDLWYSVFKSWFEENSGLKVSMMVDSRNDKRLLEESVDNSNIVEEIMGYAGIKYDGHEFLERTYDNFGRTHDTVIFYFRLPDDDFSYYRRIHFLTRNNKVISVDSAGDFRTIDDAFRYVPTDVLMNYFIEKGKTYLEKFLPKRYPSDNINESKEKNNNLLLETKGVKAAQLLIDMAVDDYVEICDKRKAFQNIELALCKGFKNGTVKLEVTKVDEIKNDRFEDNVFYVAHLILYVDKEWMLEDSYYEKFETSLAMRLEKILGFFKYYCYIDEVKMNDSVIK